MALQYGSLSEYNAEQDRGLTFRSSAEKEKDMQGMQRSQQTSCI